MFNRPLHQQPFSLPKGIKLPSPTTFPIQNVYHTPGQNAAIRFFDPHSQEDLQAMREILKGKQVRRWMDEPNISKSDYKEWAGTESDTSFLFAVLDARATTPEEAKHVRGFIYIYSEREEKFRVRRMEKLGFIEPTNKQRYALEVSFAMRPLQSGVQMGSGLMSSSLRQSCLQVHMLLNSPERPDVILFACIDPENLNAQRTVESSGFVKKGLMKYDWDSEDYTLLYILNWRLLQKKVRQRLLEVLQKAE